MKPTSLSRILHTTRRYIQTEYSESLWIRGAMLISFFTVILSCVCIYLYLEGIVDSIFFG